MKKEKRIIRASVPAIKKKIKKPSIPTAIEYLVLFNTCLIAKEKISQVDKVIDENVTVPPVQNYKLLLLMAAKRLRDYKLKLWKVN
jgi:hypothetical protein